MLGCVDAVMRLAAKSYSARRTRLDTPPLGNGDSAPLY